MDLRGNVALVTGVTGTSGPVGAALSARLAGLGASVAVLDRRPDALAARIAGSGGHVLALTADVGDQHSVRAAVGRLLTAWERIDLVLTDAAGLAGIGPAVAGYLADAARTGSRGIADLMVLGRLPGSDLEQFADDLVRVEAVPLGRPDEVADQVLRLIGRPAPVTAAGA